MKINRSEALGFIQSNPGNAMTKAYRLVEKALINEALIMHRGNQTAAAKVLGISRTTLRQKLLEMSMKP